MRLGLFPGLIGRGESGSYLQGPKSIRVRSGTVLDGFDVLSLLPGFPDRVYSWNKGGGEVKQDRLTGLGGVGGVGGDEDGGQSG